MVVRKWISLKRGSNTGSRAVDKTKEEGTTEKEGKPEQMCVQKRTISVPHKEQCSRIQYFFFNLHSEGLSPNWVHLARWPFIVLLYLPRVIVRMENLVE
jgi:hypothetical protein